MPAVRQVQPDLVRAPGAWKRPHNGRIAEPLFHHKARLHRAHSAAVQQHLSDVLKRVRAEASASFAPVTAFERPFVRCWLARTHRQVFFVYL